MEFDKVRAIISEILNVEKESITLETSFEETLGADSLDIFQIIMRIEEEFDIEIPGSALQHIVTVADAVRFVSQVNVI